MGLTFGPFPVPSKAGASGGIGLDGDQFRQEPRTSWFVGTERQNRSVIGARGDPVTKTRFKPNDVPGNIEQCAPIGMVIAWLSGRIRRNGLAGHGGIPVPVRQRKHSFMSDQPPDTTQLALQRTKLAFDRTKKASERTLMAWIRTSLSMISFGFSIDTFFRAFVKAQQGVEIEPLVGPAVLGLVLVGLGTLVLILGTIDHYLYLRTIGDELHFLGKKAPWTYMFFVSLMVILIGLSIFVYLAILT